MRATTARKLAAHAAAMGALTVGGAILMGASAPEGCILPRPDPCTEVCAEPPVCGVDGVTYGCGIVEAECRGVEVAYEGPCLQECLGDEECGPGRHCSTRDGDCRPTGCDCPPDALCLCPDVCGGVCVDDPGSCESDADCGEGEYCALGPCPLAPCVEREDGTWDCPTCAGTCEPRPSECDNLGNECRDGSTCVIDYCEGCPDGAVCVWEGPCYGHCEPPPPPGCTSDAECAPGEICQAEVCPAAPCWERDDGTVECPPCWGSCVPAPTEYCDDAGATCGEGQTCVIDGCEGVVCAEGDALCEPSEYCWGHCEDARRGCLSDEECGWGGTCAFLEPCPLAGAEGGACPMEGCGPCYGECVYFVEASR